MLYQLSYASTAKPRKYNKRVCELQGHPVEDLCKLRLPVYGPENEPIPYSDITAVLTLVVWAPSRAQTCK